MRIYNSIRNVLTSVGGQLINLILGFVVRTVMIYTLGQMYLGVAGLFSSILTMLSLAELGVGSAIIFSLYKPLAEKNENEVLALMNLYKKTYMCIGIFVLLVGLSLAPFIEFFIKEDPGIEHLRLIYMLFVIHTSISYFFSYTRSLNMADQKAYRLVKVDYFFRTLEYVVSIVILITTRNYIIYLATPIIFVFVHNLVVYRKVNVFYPFLKRKDKPQIKKETEHVIVKNITAMIFYRVASVVVNATDNIIMSKYIGLGQVGIYSNYYMIIYNINAVISQAFSAIAASVGNLIATEKKEKQYSVFQSINFLTFWIYGFSSICMFVLLSPFIKIWAGNDYLFGYETVLPIVINFYMLGMQTSVNIFREAHGLFWQGKLRPLFQAIINVVVSIWLVKLTNHPAAIFWGTVISRLTTTFWFDPYIVHKHGFFRSCKKYFITYVLYTALTAAVCVLCILVGGIFTAVPVWEFLIKALICIIIPNGIFYLVFRKTPEFGYILSIIKNVLGRKNKKTEEQQSAK